MSIDRLYRNATKQHRASKLHKMRCALASRDIKHMAVIAWLDCSVMVRPKR